MISVKYFYISLLIYLFDHVVTLHIDFSISCSFLIYSSLSRILSNSPLMCSGKLSVAIKPIMKIRNASDMVTNKTKQNLNKSPPPGKHKIMISDSVGTSD